MAKKINYRSRLLTLAASLIILNFYVSLQGLSASIAKDVFPENWPFAVLSFAYTIRHDFDSIEDFEKDQPARTSPLYQQHKKLFDIFSTPIDSAVPLHNLASVGHYCHLKLYPHTNCGTPESREFTDTGYLYVSEPITEPDAEPFLLVITSTISPRHTSIYRLFDNRLELAYDLYDGPRCHLPDGQGLWATYGVEVDAQGRIILTQTEGFHWDMLPRERYQLDINATDCKLTLLERWLTDGSYHETFELANNPQNLDDR